MTKFFLPALAAAMLSISGAANAVEFNRIGIIGSVDGSANTITLTHGQVLHLSPRYNAPDFYKNEMVHFTFENQGGINMVSRIYKSV